jgi:Cbb3-type cytochrome oxidase, subunit 3
MDVSEFMQMLRSLWLVWLVLAFVGIVWWAYRPKNKQRFEEDARIPFKDGNEG